MRTLAAVAALTLIVTAAAPAQQPLPDAEAFLAAAREKLLRSQMLQNKYAYKERRTELHTNPFGRLGTGGTGVYDVVPSEDGRTITRRLVEKDGKPVADASPEQRDTPERRERAPTGRSFADVVNTLHFKVDRREILNGKPAIVVTFAAKPNADPQTRQGKIARVFAGDIWVDEQQQEVERIEATAVDTLSMGFGLVARLNKGTKVTLLRQPVADGIWLPTEVKVIGEGRALLFRRLNVDYAVEWFDYRRIRD